ncbi:uncharacterized protein SPPG_00460 [Spizellomyces punctatus DAOM BR117]|uniref:Velvet domain-containing protein n=1 Tax=Spizellomyces punctatus (strain DAOM BR117) TaxID=645134 RepID=A0A0L0HV31_SPIPD|nr:uncharacterized protein SPPG_00460 [Spizellomyces punctatus DAOM BR117]KND04755.1 hypothetical protein SPPG_00460 [Spizellomyces punctatus DAOM BR117]|eukprot:XP_016612794.1 hypothetical protein SPPG_00460 [Spizellomyces punctatus DAOM BR117]
MSDQGSSSKEVNEFSSAVPTSLELHSVERGEEVDTSSRYQLIIIQQPQRGRSCGFGEKINRRPIDPCCIVQLAYLRDDNELDSRLEVLKDVTMFVAHATLWDETGIQDRNIVIHPHSQHLPIPSSQFVSIGGEDLPVPYGQSPADSKPYVGTLFGSLVSQCHFLTDLSGTKGAYFVFPELCIRVEGTFKLKIILSNLASIKSRGVATVMATVFSDAFISYNARFFPGLQETSDLSRHFSHQGIKIPVRRKTRRRRLSSAATSEAGGEDEEELEEEKG